METYDFVAVDFENADSRQFACQVGIVCVQDNDIVKELKYNIQPPENAYGRIQTGIHGMSAFDTKDCDTIDILWPVIKPYFENQKVICHGSVDMVILKKSLGYYNIPFPDISEVIDTIKLFGKKKLIDLCKESNIPIQHHHDALCDARALAMIYIINGNSLFEYTDELNSRLTDYENVSHKKESFYTKSLEGKDPNHPLYDRKVVITGEFENYSRSYLGSFMRDCGADIDSQITKNVNFVFKGIGAGPSKTVYLDALLFNGYKIKVLGSDDIDNFINGNYESYFTTKEVEKNIDITIEHITGKKNKFIINPDKLDLFASKELYVLGNLKADRNDIYMLIGFLGALTNESIDDTVKLILISDDTISKLKSGVKDEHIIALQNQYNKSKSISFDFYFVSESDFIAYYKHRVENYYANDDVVCSVFNRCKTNYNFNYREELKFPEDKNHIKVKGKYIFRMEDGRTWCPSRQMRDQ